MPSAPPAQDMRGSSDTMRDEQGNSAVKFDMGKAWDDTTGLLRKNFGLVASIVGLFYFLPQAIVALLVPEIANFQPDTPPPGTDPKIVFEAMQAAYMELFEHAWPYWLAITVMQYFGAISALALFTKGQNPTVGQALAAGLKGTPIYIAAQLIYILAASFGLGIPLGLAFALLPLLGVLLALAAIVLIFYVAVKLMLVPTVIAIDGERNPIAAIKRSWQLTKGNSIRIFAFIFILMIVITLITLVATMIFAVIFALFGEPIATIGTGLFTALLGAISASVFLLALAAIHRQLSGTTSPMEIDAFE